MPFAKKIVAKKPTITVETKKMTENECCCGPRHHHVGKWFMILLLVINILLTVCVLGQQKRIESMRVGGHENYKMLQQVFKSDGFKVQQAQQIQQALQMYNVTPATK